MPTHHRTIEQRKAYIRKLLARGLYDHEILEACEVHPLFRFQNRRDDGSLKQLTRRSLRVYLYQVKRELRDLVPKGHEAIAEGLERLRHAYRVAVKEDNVSGMVAVQKCLNRMLGLRLGSVAPPTLEVDDIRRQLLAMDQSVLGTPEDSEPRAEKSDDDHAS